MFRTIVFICLISAVFIFVFQNMQVVEVKFLLWSLTVSRALILFITLAIGLIVGYLLGLPGRRRKAETD